MCLEEKQMELHQAVNKLIGDINDKVCLGQKTIMLPVSGH